MLHLELSFGGAETWKLRKVNQKYLENLETWCCRNMEKIMRAYCVKNEVLHKVKKGRNILSIIKRRKANWIGHICVGTSF